MCDIILKEIVFSEKFVLRGMKMKRSRGFLLCFLLNLVFNFALTIPAWILLVLHFYLGWSIWWFVLGIAFWIITVLLRTLIISWGNRSGNYATEPRENKNPYSSSGYIPTKSIDENR